MPAWVDESVNVRLGVYLLCAYTCSSDQENLARTSLANSPLGQRRRFHWRNEKEELRIAARDLIATLPGGLVIVIGTGLVNSRQERARQVCFRQLLLHLDNRGVGDIVLERRDPHLNRRDIRTLEGLRGAGWIRAVAHVSHGDPNVDEMLWIADAVCGLSSRALGTDFEDLSVLARTHVIRIPVT